MNKLHASAQLATSIEQRPTFPVNLRSFCLLLSAAQCCESPQLYAYVSYAASVDGAQERASLRTLIYLGQQRDHRQDRQQVRRRSSSLLSKNMATKQQERGEPEWQKIQTKTLTNWFNSRLKGNLRQSSAQVSDLATDLEDGVLLHQLVSTILKGKRRMPRCVEKPKMKVQKLQNLGHSLQVLKDDKVKIVNIGKCRRLVFFGAARVSVRSFGSSASHLYKIMTKAA